MTQEQEKDQGGTITLVISSPRPSLNGAAKRFSRSQSLFQQCLSPEQEAGLFSSPGQISAADSFILQILTECLPGLALFQVLRKQP